MINVYFKNIHNEIITELSKAKSNIKICVAWFTDIDIYNTTVTMQKNGIQTDIILANHEFNKNSKVDFQDLLYSNGRVSYLGSNSNERLMHNKFCIIDNKTIITGSYNWTYKARFNEENILIIKNEPKVTEQFKKKFYELNPKYGFILEENTVLIQPIEKIISKWDNNKSPKSKSDKELNIFNKF